MPDLRSLLILALLVVTPAGAEVQLSGHLVQGGLLIGTAPPGSQVMLDDEPVLVAEDGRFLVGFGRDTTGPHRLSVRTADDGTWEQILMPQARSFEIQRIDGLPSEKVTPRPEVLERIGEEAALARQARTRRDARTDWEDGFVWPLTGRITGVYGSQRILNGQARAPHWGLDIAAPTGTPVQAPAAGIVSLVHPDMYFSGGTLFLDHGHGLVSAFLHLSDILVDAGQRVEQGEIIARVGATGRATGPHLDWRISLGDVRIDPALLLPQQSQ